MKDQIRKSFLLFVERVKKRKGSDRRQNSVILTLGSYRSSLSKRVLLFNSEIKIFYIHSHEVDQ